MKTQGDNRFLKEELHRKTLEISKYKNQCESIMSEWRSRLDIEFNDLSQSNIGDNKSNNRGGSKTPSFHQSRILGDLSRSASKSPLK